MKYWQEVRNTYKEFKNFTDLSSRDLELWKPIISLAIFFEDKKLIDNIIQLAQRITSSAQLAESEMHEFLLVETLLNIVNEDNFYRLGNLKNLFAEKFETSNWLSERYTGKLLRRMGFQVSRRMSHGIEYFLRVAEIREVAQGFGLEIVSVGSELGVDAGEGGAE